MSAKRIKGLWFRRGWAIMLACALVSMLCIDWSVATDLADEKISKRWMFFDGIYPVIDSANGRALVYWQSAGTTGAAVDTLALGAADSVWAWDSVAVGGVFRGRHYDDHSSSWAFQNKLVFGSGSPDGFLNRSESIIDNILHARMLSDTTLHPRHVCADSMYVMGIDSAGVVNIHALPATVFLETEWSTWFAPSLDDSLVLGTYDAYFDSLTADSSFLPEIECDTMWAADSSAVWIESILTDGTVIAGPNPEADAGISYEDNTLDVTTDFTGGHFSFTKTAGASDASDDYKGVYGEAHVGDADKTHGHVYGGDVKGHMGSGTLGANKDLIGIRAVAKQDQAGTIGGDGFGGYVELDQDSGTISGDAHALYITGDLDGTVSGTAYFLTLKEGDGFAHCLYQDGTSDNTFGGELNLPEIDVDRICALDSTEVEIAQPWQPDTSLYGTTTMPSPSALWTANKSGAEVGDKFIWGWTGVPPEHGAMNTYVFDMNAITCAAPGVVTFDPASNGKAIALGSGAMWYCVYIRPPN